MSLKVVINGPEGRAGSIFSFLKTMGTMAPTVAVMVMDSTREMEMARERARFF